ncbi:MAG: alpha/beta hydrolase [Phycisphaeraceae bacterium]
MHPSGVSSVWFEPAVEQLSERWQVVSYDRPGWGRSAAPDDYRRTSIAEQSITAAGVLRELDISGARVLGAGFGAVVALELALAEPDLVKSLVLVEPPLYDTLAGATEGMSEDVAAIRDAASDGGQEAVWALFLDGGLPTLGAGAERFARFASAAGPAAPHTLLVELPAVPAWPLDPVRIASLATEITVATTPSAPEILIEAARSVVSRIPGARGEATAKDGAEAVSQLLDRV